MMEKKHWNKSWLLSKILDQKLLGTQEQLDINRRTVLMIEYFCDAQAQMILTGSSAEGLHFPGSDTDIMWIPENVAVLYSETYPDIAENIFNKSVFFLREADCQPGYVALELASFGENMFWNILPACVPFQNSIFLSSDILRQVYVDELTRSTGIDHYSSGPCASYRIEKIGESDQTCAFPCLNWPREALAWVSRTRLYGWPSRALINKIVLGGCHVVPVGDKCSEDTFLQWRLSFATAERQLVCSLSRQQMKVYALMKHFLNTIRDLFKSLFKEDKILTSYIMKTIIFYAVENSPPSMWQDSKTFTCFRFCLSILIDWVRFAYCPHYFIPQNNLFLRKVCGPNQQKLLQALLKVQGMEWNFLSIGNSYIGRVLECLQTEKACHLYHIYPSLEYLEYLTEYTMCKSTFYELMPRLTLPVYSQINKVTNALTKSQTDKDEFVLYKFFLECLAQVAKDNFVRNVNSGGNKNTYKYLKKCKHLFAPLASLCTSPGKLYLATFHYLVGNYDRVLHICKTLTLSSRFLITTMSADMYMAKFCGKGYSWYQKCDRFPCPIFLRKQFCPHDLFLEARIQNCYAPLAISPLPYGLFLTFLSHYYLGDTRRCKISLKYLERECNKLFCYRETGINDDHEGNKHWIVYTLLGICYQYIGDYSMAMAAFSNSLKVGPTNNPAKERMATVNLLMCNQNKKTE